MYRLFFEVHIIAGIYDTVDIRSLSIHTYQQHMEIAAHKIHFTDTIAKITILLRIVGRIIFRHIFYNQVSLANSFINAFPILTAASRQGVGVPCTVVEVVRDIPFYVRAFAFVGNSTVTKVLKEYQRTVRLLCFCIHIRHQAVHLFVTGEHVRFRNVVIIVTVQIITARSK